jgi:hypothetical protein
VKTEINPADIVDRGKICGLVVSATFLWETLAL